MRACFAEWGGVDYGGYCGGVDLVMNAEKEKRLHAKCKRQGSEIARLTQIVKAQREEIAAKRIILQNGLADVDGWKIDGAAEIARHHKPRGRAGD